MECAFVDSRFKGTRTFDNVAIDRLVVLACELLKTGVHSPQSSQKYVLSFFLLSNSTILSYNYSKSNKHGQGLWNSYSEIWI